MPRPVHPSNHEENNRACSFSTACSITKEKLRSEIRSQIAEYLSHGGRISVVDTGSRGETTNFGSVWHGQDELRAYVD